MLFALSTVLVSSIASSPALTAATPNKAKTPEISSTVSKIDASSLGKVVPVEDVNNDRIKPSEPVDQISRNAMTWKMLTSPLVLNGKTYVLFGSDNGQPGGTNAYNGDTSINEYRSLLCINKEKVVPAPAGLPPSSVTPGGATKTSWSGGKVLVIPNIQGKQLTSQAVADDMCAQVGKITRGTSGYRMAEFHDGTGENPGWSFWAEAYSDINGLAPSTRYWVNINDQPANPWGNNIR